LYEESRQTVILYKRHKAGCQYSDGPSKDDNQNHRCQCSISMEFPDRSKGKAGQIEVRRKGVVSLAYRQVVKVVRNEAGQPVTSWTEAKAIVSQNAKPLEPASPSSLTVADAVATFLKHNKDQWAATTYSKSEHSLQGLIDYCNGEGITLLADVTKKTLDNWKSEWKTLKTAASKRNHQERVRAFFRHCFENDDIAKNPTLLWKPTKTKNLAMAVSPLEKKDYDKLIKAVDHVKAFTPTASVRVKTLMQLQRWSGLSLVDAVLLDKNELVKDGDVYRIVTTRQKTDSPVNNVIPASLAKDLLTVKNGNPKYFFQTGAATPKSAVSTFDKQYRKVFAQAGIATDGMLSHRFRHTFAVELLKHGVDIRKVSKALGHGSVTITERYYAKWNKAQQEMLDDDLTGAWGK
jgi:site-specific recombinase XerD